MKRSDNKKLINQYNGKWIPFRDLPLNYKNAVIIYSFGAREQWKDYSYEERKAASRELNERYGDKKFGIANVPTAKLKELLFSKKYNTDIKTSFKNFAEYHNWYTTDKYDPLEFHRTQWAILLSSFPDELFQDGWHRFHSYVKQKRRVCPVLVYPD